MYGAKAAIQAHQRAIIGYFIVCDAHARQAIACSMRLVTSNSHYLCTAGNQYRGKVLNEGDCLTARKRQQGLIFTHAVATASGQYDASGDRVIIMHRPCYLPTWMRPPCACCSLVCTFHVSCMPGSWPVPWETCAQDRRSRQ